MIGTRLDHYEITAHLGSGGMGDVYQAVDSKLGRSVAIKVLPDLFAGDAERIARFEREARVLASLNNPHIAALYGLERLDTQTFLVMELVPGETLSEWIARTRGHSRAHVVEALSIARQIAVGLEAAHQSGVIHRDLKPANIKVTPEGAVKILDFGLAKVSSARESAVDVSLSPTITNASAMTAAGVILGTAAYMSPEQAKGHIVDKRSDIWAFGCIVYEILTGSRLFDAPDVSETLAAVLTRNPDWSRLSAGLHPSVIRLLKRCLERDRSKRMSDVAGAIFALDEAQEAGPTSATSSSRRWAVAGWIVAGVTAMLALVAGGLLLRREPSTAQTMHLQVSLPVNDVFTFALSPDGGTLAYRGLAEGKDRLWLRSFESGQERPLEGTTGAYGIFWAPNGQSLAFFADGWLKRVDLADGYVRKIVAVPGTQRPGSWNNAGTMIYSTATSGLFKVSAEGGAHGEPVTTLKTGQSSHRFSQFLPDGRHFLYLALGEPEQKGIYLGSLDSTTTTRLVDGEPAFTFLPPSHVVFVREGALWAQRLDIDAGRLQGSPVPVAPEILVDAQVNGQVALSASLSRTLAYRPAPETRQVVWVDREGKQTGVLADADRSQELVNSVSRDGRTIAVRRTVDGNTDVWVIDVARGSLRRVTVNAAIDGDAKLSPSGNRIYYSSDPHGTLWDIYVKDVDGGMEMPLFARPENDYSTDVSPDERYLLFSGEHGDSETDIWALPLSGSDRKPFPLVTGPANEFGALFSPDGQWILFYSDESGRLELYAQSFPQKASRVQISRGGSEGGAMRWTTSGEVLYSSSGGKMMSVPITQKGATLVVGQPRELFTKVPGDSYIPMPDGTRFLVNRFVAPPRPMEIILNWKPPK